MDMVHRHATGQGIGHAVDLLEEVFAIGLHRSVVVDRRGVAGTEPAETVAEGDVDIERKLFIARQFGQPAAIDRAVDAAMKMRRGRIAGVARYVRGKHLVNRGHGIPLGRQPQ